MNSPCSLNQEKEAVLHICLSHGWGGMELYLLRIAKEFIKKDHKVYALCLKNSQLHKELLAQGIETFVVNSKSQLVLTQLITLNNWLKERKVTIIHSHKSGDILVSSLLHKLTARKAFFTEHMGGRSSKKDIFHKMTYQHLNRVFSISEETYQRNIQNLPLDQNKIIKLWHGTQILSLPSEEEINNQRNKLTQDLNSTLIGCVGRFCDGKGQFDLVKAFKIIADLHDNCELFLIGAITENEGADIAFVEQIQKYLEKHNLTNKVKFLGYQSDTFSILAALDIACIPSHNEAFGLTVIEAMSAQKAIVASNSGAFPEILQNTALYFEPKNPEDLAKQIFRYINSSELRIQNAKEARSRAVRHFSMDTHVKKLSEYYSHF